VRIFTRNSFLIKSNKQLAVLVALLAVAYFLAGKLGLSLAIVHPSSSAIWAPTGIALAAFLLFGVRVWPGVLIGAFFVNVTTEGTALTSLGIAVGNTLEAVVAAHLVARFAHGRSAFDRASNSFKFAALAGVLAPVIAATIGTTTLSLAGFAPWSNFKPIWITWWLGDGTGALLVAPLILLWAADASFRWGRDRVLEMAALVIGLILVAEIVFCGLFLSGAKGYPLEYLCIPFLLWAAMRFGQKEAIAVTAILAGIAAWGTIHGFGPFVTANKNSSLLLLQAFTGIVAIMTMALAAMSVERRRIEAEVGSLAVTDPLTGLANYRKLVDVLDAEVRRSNRTGRAFSVLLVDMDHLKTINDRHGHVVGSRALCRIADILRVYSRGIDTAARYGGDEFALVMPETSEREAQQVASRICDRIKEDPEEPRISVSIGTAVYPKSGETIELLLDAADRAMYEMKVIHHEADGATDGAGEFARAAVASVGD
jgi:diguanylate cyclase (GGDEF)-like protein